MSRKLTITADIESDHTLALKAKVDVDGFSGYGEAWFNSSEVRKFITQIRDFNDTMENPPHLQGGHWDGDGNITDLLLSLRFYALSDYRSGLHIHLSDFPSTYATEEEVSKVTVGMKPNKHEISKFCDDMELLLSNTQTEAHLTSK